MNVTVRRDEVGSHYRHSGWCLLMPALSSFILCSVAFDSTGQLVQHIRRACQSQTTMGNHEAIHYLYRVRRAAVFAYVKVVTVGLFTMWFILNSQGSYTVSFKIHAPCKLMFFWTVWWTFLIVPGVAKQAIYLTAAAAYCKCIHYALKITKRCWRPCRIPWFEVV